MISNSTTKMCLAVIGIFAIYSDTHTLYAQSNHDLIAPVTSMYPPPKDTGLPEYAMASLTTEGKLKISKTQSIKRSDPNEDPAPKPLEYIVTVPYLATSTVGGETIVEEKFKVEKKVRLVPGNLKGFKEEAHKTTELSAHSYELVDGTKLNLKQAKKILAGRTPILLINEGETIHPFFKAIVKPDTVIIVSRKEKEPMK